ncbi:hypothetical protein SAMN05444342_2918 [Haladaptatus paucihalophilus DX253]|uniref:Uncharacterized protein n=1 Tax=Haladaptatus paucihalophilus DX253 TaxID=797209 RepID=A0A1M6XMB9_HALPU|nr:hypothetical protein SAMN05444342_2918 [Haladaptatus paucihalophilus DX253]
MASSFVIFSSSSYSSSTIHSFIRSLMSFKARMGILPTCECSATTVGPPAYRVTAAGRLPLESTTAFFRGGPAVSDRFRARRRPRGVLQRGIPSRTMSSVRHQGHFSFAQSNGAVRRRCPIGPEDSPIHTISSTPHGIVMRPLPSVKIPFHYFSVSLLLVRTIICRNGMSHSTTDLTI